MIKRSLTRSKWHPNALNKQPDYAKQGATPSQPVLMSRASTLSLLDDRFVRMLDLRSHASALAWPLSLFLVGAAARNPLSECDVSRCSPHKRTPGVHRATAPTRPHPIWPRRFLRRAAKCGCLSSAARARWRGRCGRSATKLGRRPDGPWKPPAAEFRPQSRIRHPPTSPVNCPVNVTGHPVFPT